MNEEKSLSEQLMAGLTGGDEPDTQDPPEGEEAEEQELPEGEEAPDGDEPEGDEELDAEGEEEAEEEGEGEEGEEEAEEEGEEPAVKKAPAKEPDPINDPLPKGTLESTRERFQHVVTQLKEQTTRAETAESQLDEMVSAVRDAGMDGEKYAVMLSYAQGVNSGDPAQMKRSYDILMGELKNLATALGEPMPGANPLEGHPDLIKLVEEKKTTPEIALETAINRNRAAAAKRLQQAQQNSQQGSQAYQAAVQKSAADFTALGKQLSLKDGAEEYKRKAGMVISMFQDAIMALPPQKRLAAFRQAYDKVPAAPKIAKPSVSKAPVKKGAVPLRGNKRPSGNSAQKAPKSMKDALLQGLRGGD